jgi:hypothetical protein
MQARYKSRVDILIHLLHLSSNKPALYPIFQLSTQPPPKMVGPSVKIIFGAGDFGRHGKVASGQFLEILEKHNIKDLDTAALYVGTLKPPSISAVTSNGLCSKC